MVSEVVGGSCRNEEVVLVIALSLCGLGSTNSPSLKQPPVFASGRRFFTALAELTNVVVHRRAQPKQLGSFLRRRHNPARIDARAQHPNLSLKQLNPRVVSGTHPLRQKYQYRVENRIHTNSFRLETSFKRPKNTGNSAVDTFPNPLAPGGFRVFPERNSRSIVVGV